MKKSIKSIIFFSLFALIGFVTFSGCKKTKSTTAKIIVRDSENSVVPLAWVRVYATSSTPGTTKVPVINDSTQTNAVGEAYFNYDEIYKSGQAGVAVLNITGRKDLLFGKGIIKVEPQTETEATIFLE